MTDSDSTPIFEDAKRFDVALARLESALAASVQKVADMARRTGFEDGIAHATSHILDAPAADADLRPILRDELDAVRARENSLQEAVTAARTALDEAMDDIRAALGPL